jgi:hypothetical protein
LDAAIRADRSQRGVAENQLTQTCQLQSATMHDRSRVKSGSQRGVERRARRRAGIAFDLTVRTHTRRLTAALRAATRAEGRDFPDGNLTRPELESALDTLVTTFVTRWLGPDAKK